MRSDWKSKTLSVLLLMHILWLPDIILGATETVSIPVTLEYPFIKSVLIHQLYKAPGERAIVIDEAQGDCVHIELSNPEVGQERSLIKVGSNIKIRAGVPVPFLGYCAGTMEWEGYVVVLQRLVLDDKSWRASFQTVDSRIYDSNRNPGTITSRFWDLIKMHVHPYLDRTNIELAPPIKEMKEFLPLVFLPKERRQVDRWLETLRLGPVQTEESAVKVNILLDVQITPKPRASVVKLSPSEIENLTRTWEDWDAFLIFEIESLIGQPITDIERGHLMEIILENRHEFLQALDHKTISSNLVRQQFIRTWQRFSHILRKYLVDHKSRPLFGYLAFFTASDTLVALDKLGPTLGVEISRDGLIRLARLLSASGADPTLKYSYSLDPALRKFLGFGPPLDDSGPALDAQELNLPQDQETNAKPGDLRSWLDHFLFPRAWAKEEPPSVLDQVKPWLPSAQNPEIYLGKVLNLLEEAAGTILSTYPLDGSYTSFFHILVLATAWQESCWRQFIARDGKVRYLISYNKSSVGLMQINERVWRGIYRLESLRWNISYNVRAGNEILHLYLRNFALKEITPASPADLDTIARITYAMYNAGPSQLKQYIKRINSRTSSRIDELFWEKYKAVKEAKFDELVLCVSGR